MPVTIATPINVTALTIIVNTAYRGESSQRGWTSEAHLLSGSRIDETTMAGYFTDPNVTILKHTDNEDSITGCVYLEAKQNKLYLGMLSVHPDLQDGGIGRQLLAAADEFATLHQLPVIAITVISTRTELIEWYERRGFVRTGGELPFHAGEKFGKPHQPIVLIEMEKRLKG
ncbi:GNAT family N-acetyltransferase [Mucilaginibacter myungsuensis]|uniref:GNAT family N-acetyltransferase n=1 Tax=Mucilaginibacter myungsuensis TaxID=649104 RepID=A0A929PY12_9SPHI|nr:GNAT family N-acetyltransferase [Mucilaginibacter myungsuensis]MBE9664413.1 GNAT family N-acetyltransferase [Mucilaginibacter myungsuensis]MDN3597124.1 GNAT family N-acetyltransferase [Mucilaginibacter myungsuensis]